MENTRNSQDKPESVPLSSSPATTTSDSEGSVANLTTAELPPSSPPVDKRAETSSTQLTAQDQTLIIGLTEDCMSNGDSNLPLLSPFAVLKNEHSSTYEKIRAQSITLQRVLHSMPSSPPVSLVSSEHPGDASSLATNVLRSPFGVHPKSASSLSDDLFVSPPGVVSSKSETSTNSEDAGVSHKDVNVLSDSGESTAGPLSTPKTSKTIPHIASSSPFVATTMCVDTDYIRNNKNIQNIARDFNLTLELSGSNLNERSHPKVLESEVTSLARSLPLDGQSHTPTVHSMSPKYSPASDKKAPDMLLQKSPIKRAREGDEKEAAPAPKRMTLASQQRQHKKLASPFRSPLLSRSNASNIPATDTERMASRHASPLSCSLDDNKDRPSTPVNKLPRLGLPFARPRTPLSSSAKAKAPFKSPLVSSSPAKTSVQISNSRNVQDLERKVQLLKRAIKIKKEGDEEKLEELVKKWRTVGREAAWELWQIVRDNEETPEAPYPGTNSESQGASFGNWGWGGASGPTQTNSWGWDRPPENQMNGEDIDSDELESPTKVARELFDALRRTPAVPRTSMLPPTPRGAYYERRTIDPSFKEFEKETGQRDGGNSQDEAPASGPSKTLGGMLHQLGIAHETLGWAEEEGDFVDD